MTWPALRHSVLECVPALNSKFPPDLIVPPPQAAVRKKPARQLGAPAYMYLPSDRGNPLPKNTLFSLQIVLELTFEHPTVGCRGVQRT
jgi:hypothetical protein